MRLYQAIARKVAMFHASTGANRDTLKHDILIMVREHMPSGSGFDNGTQIDLDKSNLSKLTFNTGFHHMNDAGYYIGWTHHVVTLRANLDGHYIRVSGPNKRSIKEDIENTFDDALNEDINVW